MQRTFASIVAALLIWPAAAGAQRAQITQELWDGRGDPVLLGQGVPEGKGRVSWRVCGPAENACRPIGNDIQLAPGLTDAGTFFELTVEYRGRRTRDISHEWLGRLTLANPPRLDGTPSVGSIVTPVTAAWSGGWSGYAPRGELRIEACRTPPTGCVSISQPVLPGREEPVGGTTVTVPEFAAGRFLQVLGRPEPRDVWYGRPAYLTPDAVPPMRRDPIVAVSPPVRVAPALPGSFGSPFSAAAWARGR